MTVNVQKVQNIHVQVNVFYTRLIYNNDWFVD